MSNNMKNEQPKQSNGDGTLDFEGTVDKLKTELSLQYEGNIPSVENKNETWFFPFWCQSDAARFVYTQKRGKNFLSKRGGGFDEEEMEFMAAMMRSMSQRELKYFIDTLEDEEAFKSLKRRAEWMYFKLYEDKVDSRRNKSVDELIVDYSGGDSNAAFQASVELQTRFGAQSHSDQIKIIRTLLKGEHVERDWCYDALRTWWDDEVIPDIQKAWETYSDKGCAWIVARKLPSDYVMEQRLELGVKDYASVCVRLATNKDFVVDTKRLTKSEFLEVVEHNRWQLDDADADELLYGYLMDIYTGRNHTYICLEKYNSVLDFTVQADRMKYRPSLLSVEGLADCINALAKAGKVNTIAKFYNWNKYINRLLDVHLAEPLVAEQAETKAAKDFYLYKLWLWDELVGIAEKNSLFNVKDFVRTHEEYHFARPAYYPGYAWKEHLWYERL